MKESYFTVVTALILRAGRTYQHLLGSLRLWAHWGSVGLRIVAKLEIVDFVGEDAPPYQLLSSHFSPVQKKKKALTSADIKEIISCFSRFSSLGGLLSLLALKSI